MNKLSVAIITYNEEKNIKRCLESVLEILSEYRASIRPFHKLPWEPWKYYIFLLEIIVISLHTWQLLNKVENWETVSVIYSITHFFSIDLWAIEAVYTGYHSILQ